MHETGDLELDVFRSFRCEQRRALEVMRERGHDIAAALVVEHCAERSDGSERLGHPQIFAPSWIRGRAALVLVPVVGREEVVFAVGSWLQVKAAVGDEVVLV